MRIPVGLLVAAACVAGSPVKDKKGGHGAGKGCTGECAARPTAYTAKPFAKDAFAEYYAGFEPTQTSVQPQPKVTDIVSPPAPARLELIVTDAGKRQDLPAQPHRADQQPNSQFYRPDCAPSLDAAPQPRG